MCIPFYRRRYQLMDDDYPLEPKIKFRCSKLFYDFIEILRTRVSKTNPFAYRLF